MRWIVVAAVLAGCAPSPICPDHRPSPAAACDAEDERDEFGTVTHAWVAVCGDEWSLDCVGNGSYPATCDGTMLVPCDGLRCELVPCDGAHHGPGS